VLRFDTQDVCHLKALACKERVKRVGNDGIICTVRRTVRRIEVLVDIGKRKPLYGAARVFKAVR